MRTNFTADPSTAPLLVTVELDAESFARLDGLRRRYFPAERNFIPAHVSLFHHLPPTERDTVERALAGAAARPAPVLRFGRLRRLGRGMATDVEAPELASVHRELAAAFAPWLTPQDRQPFRPHVTLMNKATPDEAERAFAELGASWMHWDGRGEALLLWRYLGGPWALLARLPFGA
ncbi:2'-5' RNA ligase family protein [Pyxidicoccus fallax]|uniref:2'-5' RNA ligase family protein n=1 Tax=Pyxidicoccus fallax TaxID=394095 RepID=A0A848LEX4_9BACT|nr:2'-5' RNA ligase family protein [Pyxidicoccus fallax]NPC80723.1 2'-5' RNA ligase family protein [Pyxidicoccus fallax]